jgi:hypothetical protein
MMNPPSIIEPDSASGDEYLPFSSLYIEYLLGEDTSKPEAQVWVKGYRYPRGELSYVVFGGLKNGSTAPFDVYR